MFVRLLLMYEMAAVRVEALSSSESERSSTLFLEQLVGALPGLVS